MFVCCDRICVPLCPVIGLKVVCRDAMLGSMIHRYECFFFIIFSWGETESIWYCGHCLTYFTSPRWYVMIVEQLVELRLAG
jgi:hypothetical protein